MTASKAAVRERLLTARAALPPAARAAASAAICQRLRRLPELAGAQAVLGYAAFGAEASVDAFLRDFLASGGRVLLPWVASSESSAEAVEAPVPKLGVGAVTDLDSDLEPGWRGIREPAPGRRLETRPEEADAVFAPAVAVDRRGNRLGYGGGYFDRLLRRVRRGVPVIAIVFDLQLIDAVPAEPHDHQIDVIVTETAVIRA